MVIGNIDVMNSYKNENVFLLLRNYVKSCLKFTCLLNYNIMSRWKGDEIMAFNMKNKVPKVKFYGFNEEKKYENSKNEVIVSKRLMILIGMTVFFVFILIARLAFIQFTQADNLQVKLDTYGSTTYTSSAPRGEIYDRNYTKLVENQNIICINYYAPQSIKNEEISLIAEFLSQNLNIDLGNKNINNITSRNLKDYFIMAHKDVADSLITDEEKKQLKKQENSEKAIYNLQIERITDELIFQYMSQDDIEKTRFEYLMKSCKSGSIILAEGISVEEASVIGENTNLLKGIQVSTDWSRNNLTNNQFTQVLGKVTTKKEGLPSEMKDQLLALGYQNDARVGTSGLESQYEDILRGTDSKYSLSYDSNGNPIVTNEKTGSKGDNIRITIDWELQQYADTLIENELKACKGYNKYFNKMFFVMMDPKTGDIIVMSGKKIDDNGEVTDLSSGNYLEGVKIGSTSKAGTLYMAFKENIIKPNTYFVDEPIHIKGTKEKKSWTTMGNINEVDAMARSSNVYMFRIAMLLGGANYVPYESLNIDTKNFVRSITTLRRDFGELGLGVKTGLDVPKEELGYRGNKTEAGLLLDACIGQYDTYTPIQLVQYTSTLANNGKRVRPHLLLDSFRMSDNGEQVTTYSQDTEILDDVSDQSTAFERIKLGMRACVTRTDGTSHTYWSEKPYVVYAKTGTAEDYDPGDSTDYPNHLQIGYISATEDSEPIVAFASIAVRQSKASTGADSSAPYIAHQVVDKYVEKYGLN